MKRNEAHLEIAGTPKTFSWTLFLDSPDCAIHPSHQNYNCKKDAARAAKRVAKSFGISIVTTGEYTPRKKWR